MGQNGKDPPAQATRVGPAKSPVRRGQSRLETRALRKKPSALGASVLRSYGKEPQEAAWPLFAG